MYIDISVHVSRYYVYVCYLLLYVFIMSAKDQQVAFSFGLWMNGLNQISNLQHMACLRHVEITQICSAYCVCFYIQVLHTFPVYAISH